MTHVALPTAPRRAVSFVLSLPLPLIRGWLCLSALCSLLSATPIAIGTSDYVHNSNVIFRYLDIYQPPLFLFHHYQVITSTCLQGDCLHSVFIATAHTSLRSALFCKKKKKKKIIL
ncbi:hypothetical protein F5Y07DRAFT_355911, partial [Xylaria sp. FL0933]